VSSQTEDRAGNKLQKRLQSGRLYKLTERAEVQRKQYVDLLQDRQESVKAQPKNYFGGLEPRFKLNSPKKVSKNAIPEDETEE
jgi:hypothetical protein